MKPLPSLSTPPRAVSPVGPDVRHQIRDGPVDTGVDDGDHDRGVAHRRVPGGCHLRVRESPLLPEVGVIVRPVQVVGLRDGDARLGAQRRDGLGHARADRQPDPVQLRAADGRHPGERERPRNRLRAGTLRRGVGESHQHLVGHVRASHPTDRSPDADGAGGGQTCRERAPSGAARTIGTDSAIRASTARREGRRVFSARALHSRRPGEPTPSRCSWAIPAGGRRGSGPSASRTPGTRGSRPRRPSPTHREGPTRARPAGVPCLEDRPSSRRARLAGCACGG